MSEAQAPYTTGDAIKFSYQIFKIQTLIDGGVRMTIDFINIPPATIVKLMEAKRPGIIIESANVIIDTDDKPKPTKSRY